jgi:hypothetical protein
MRKRGIKGECFLCGEYGELELEHIPPKSCGNDFHSSIKLSKFNFSHFIETGEKKWDHCQGAITYPCYCRGCNGFLGRTYVRDFKSFCGEALKNLDKSKIQFYHIFPLRVIKHILSTFVAINGISFSKNNPEIISFIREPEKKGLNPEYNIYICYYSGNILTYTGLHGIIDTENGTQVVKNEICFPPFAYFLSHNSHMTNVFNINFFANSSYDEKRELQLPMENITKGSIYPIG